MNYPSVENVRKWKTSMDVTEFEDMIKTSNDFLIKTRYVEVLHDKQIEQAVHVFEMYNELVQLYNSTSEYTLPLLDCNKICARRDINWVMQEMKKSFERIEFSDLEMYELIVVAEPVYPLAQTHPIPIAYFKRDSLDDIPDRKHRHKKI
jgi:hypothetical protein